VSLQILHCSDMHLDKNFNISNFARAKKKTHTRTKKKKTLLMQECESYNKTKRIDKSCVK
jgi:hypothetical protein